MRARRVARVAAIVLRDSLLTVLFVVLVPGVIAGAGWLIGLALDAPTHAKRFEYGVVAIAVPVLLLAALGMGITFYRYVRGLWYEAQ